MPTVSEQEKLYKLARKKAKAKKGFYRHFTLYLIISVFLFLLNSVEPYSAWWCFYPIASWGTAVAIHYFMLFGLPFTKAGTSEWEAKQVQKELAKLQASTPLPLKSAPSQTISSAKLDERLELREVAEKELLKESGYSREDLV